MAGSRRFWMIAGAGIGMAIGPHIVEGWWLDSAESARHSVVLLAIAAGFVGIRWPADHRVYRYLWAGFNTGKVVILGAIGPGNLFPIVICVGALLSAVGVGIGFVAAAVTVAIARRGRVRTHNDTRASS